MPLSPELEERIKVFDKNRNFKNSKPDWVDKSAEQQKKFDSAFPKDQIRKIDMLKYVSGKKPTDRTTFTWMLEFGSREFGRLGGRGMKKYVVGMDQKTQKIVHVGPDSIDKTYKKTINLFADCVDAAGGFDKDKDWEKLSDTITEKIESQKFTPYLFLITKAIAMYYPENFLYIWAHSYLNKTMDLFGIPHDDLPEGTGNDRGGFYKKMKRLVDAKNSHPIMKEWDNKYFRELVEEMHGYGSTQPTQKDSPLLKFLKDEMVMQANYQPIVIKILLEAKERGFTVSIKKIREKFAELNFAPISTKTTATTKVVGKYDSIRSVKSALEGTRGMVSFTGYDGNDTASLKLDKFDSTDIPECLMICGQKIAKWHIDEIANDGFNMWGVWAGSPYDDPPLHYLKEFRDSSMIGIGYNDNIKDLSKLGSRSETDEFLKKFYADDSKSRTSILNFSHDMKKKDLVVVANGRTEIIDFCIVTSDYYWKDTDDGDIPKHRRNVVYLKIGPISKDDLPDKLLSSFIATVHKIKEPRLEGE